jgi:hypothetical protein
MIHSHSEQGTSRARPPVQQQTALPLSTQDLDFTSHHTSIASKRGWLRQQGRRMRNRIVCSLLVPVAAAAALAPVTSKAYEIGLVADNDFAVLTGTPNSILRMVYQNNVSWPDQINAASSFNLSLTAEEDTIFILVLDGGGEANLSGLINSVNLNTLTLRISHDISSLIENWTPNNSAVGDGTFNVTSQSVTNLHHALANNLISFTSVTAGSYETVPTLSGFAPGFGYGSNTAVLLQISASAVNVMPVPEPSSVILIGMGAGYLLFRRHRKGKNNVVS